MTSTPTQLYPGRAQRLPARLLALLAVLLPASPPSHAESLGRLFFTPAERQHIDHPADAAPPSPPPRLDGIVTRSAGRPTLFLDGRATPADARQVRIDTASARVAGPDGRHHQLRVGEPPPPTP